LSAVYALIPAAGRGVRFGGSENKVLATLLGKPLLGWTLEAFAATPEIEAIVLVGSSADQERLLAIGEQYGGGKLRGVVLGGTTRQESVLRGLESIPSDSPVLIHDAARCCVTPEIIQRVLSGALQGKGFATAAIRESDTLVREIPGTENVEPLSREGIWRIQTPQGFKSAQWLQKAHEKAGQEGLSATDDFGLMQVVTGASGYLRKGSSENLKVTEPEDILLAEAILGRRVASPIAIPLPTKPTSPAPAFRIGHGYDVHQFAEAASGRKMFLGGVEFPESPVGLLGHSDADVILHAVCDALLGAVGAGDIGVLFPPSDNRHKDRDSKEFLIEVGKILLAHQWKAGNIDITVLAETPKIGPRAKEIRACISNILGIEIDQVSVKATTNEKMGFIGRGEGIAAHATVLVYR
jgi:2-C-methyl-D-erythritol 4-phosphate cytidylyltransferase / 2-C-methyl-D-erythritol 2,4-cyclodiphosphate synthase